MLTKKMREDIARCDDFLCLVSTHWAASPTARQQLAYAQSLGKPIIALIQSTYRLPPELTHVLQDCEKHYWSTREDLQAIHEMLMQRYPVGLNYTDGPCYD